MKREGIVKTRMTMATFVIGCNGKKYIYMINKHINSSIRIKKFQLENTTNTNSQSQRAKSQNHLLSCRNLNLEMNTILGVLDGKE